MRNNKKDSQQEKPLKRDQLMKVVHTEELGIKFHYIYFYSDVEAVTTSSGSIENRALKRRYEYIRIF